MIMNGMISFFLASVFDVEFHPEQASAKSKRKELSSRLDTWLGEVRTQTPLPRKISVN
jgi:hypothetical protein